MWVRGWGLCVWCVCLYFFYIMLTFSDFLDVSVSRWVLQVILLLFVKCFPRCVLLVRVYHRYVLCVCVCVLLVFFFVYVLVATFSCNVCLFVRGFILFVDFLSFDQFLLLLLLFHNSIIWITRHGRRVSWVNKLTSID
jgi:hypothetical protein